MHVSSIHVDHACQLSLQIHVWLNCESNNAPYRTIGGVHLHHSAVLRRFFIIPRYKLSQSSSHEIRELQE